MFRFIHSGTEASHSDAAIIGWSRYISKVVRGPSETIRHFFMVPSSDEESHGRTRRKSRHAVAAAKVRFTYAIAL